jgi:hypothetical protein
MQYKQAVRTASSVWTLCSSGARLQWLKDECICCTCDNCDCHNYATWEWISLPRGIQNILIHGYEVRP